MSLGDLQEVRAIGDLHGGLITNKAGRSVFRARHRGQDIKLYEAHSATHAEFIAAIAEMMDGTPLDADRQDL